MDKSDLDIYNQENNQLVLIDNEITRKKPKTYSLASIYKVLFARLFDLVLSAIPGIIIRAVAVVDPGQWELLFIILGSSLFFILLYFVVIPYFLKGSTFGKLMFSIRLKQKGRKQPTFLSLLARESYFLLIPWVTSVICQSIAVVMLSKYSTDETVGAAPNVQLAILLTQLAYLFYAIWLGIIGITILVQTDHQSSVDMKLNLYVVNKLSIDEQSKKTKKQSKVLKRNDKHISLTEQPGNFNENQLKELYISEEEELNSSINIEKLDLVNELKINKQKNDLSIESNNEEYKKEENE